MKKVSKLMITCISFIALCSCAQKENSYETNDIVEINGTITTKTITEDGVKKEINILIPTKPIIIDNKTIEEIEIDYDKNLKDDYKVTITGTLKDKTFIESNDYSIKVDDVDDVSSLTNTYHHDDFSMTIPSSIIKLCSIEKIENGFIVYSRSNKDVGGEVFRVESVTKQEFNELRQNTEIYLERITSNSKKTIIIKFPTTTEFSEEYAEEYETIGNSINKIKNNIKQK